MIKVLLIEDEPPILRSVKGLIQKLDPEFEVADLAMDGERAMQLVQENTYDMIISDICIPVISGLQILQYVKEHAPQCYTVIISGYSDFHYMQSAMKAKVRDYLLKPVMPDALAELLNRAKRSILAEQCEEMNREIGTKLGLLPFGKNTVLSGFSGSREKYLLGLIQIGNPSVGRYRNECAGAVFFRSVSLEKLLCSGISTKGLRFFWYWGFHKSQLVTVIQTEEDYDADQVEALMRQCTAVLKERTDLPVSCVFYPGYLSAKELEDAAYRANTAFLRGYVPAKEFWHAMGEVLQEEKRKTGHYEEEQLSALLAQCIAKRDSRELGTFIERLERLDTPYEEMRQLFRRAFTVCWKRAGRREEECLERLDFLLGDSLNFQEFFRRLSAELLVMEEAEVKKDVQNRMLTEKIMMYVEDRYQEELTATGIGAHFHYSAGYINRVFRKEKGISLANYITQVRLHHAVTLLCENPELRLKEVAEITGFHDQYIFSKVFKQSMGIEPSAYRLKQLQIQHQLVSCRNDGEV